jgi:hypothetical protein
MEETPMNSNGRPSWVVGIFLFLVVGALITPAYGESPIIIKPLQWYTGTMDLGASNRATFTLQNGGSVAVVVRNIRLKTTSSCFSLTPSTPLPATLAPSGEMTVKITFAAVAEGLQRASLEIDYAEITP